MLNLSFFPFASLKLGFNDALFDPLHRMYIPESNLYTNLVSHLTGVTLLNIFNPLFVPSTNTYYNIIIKEFNQIRYHNGNHSLVLFVYQLSEWY